MVITRQQNATAEANPSVTKFSKEQNDLNIKELQECAANNAVGQYDLNLHVLGLNYSFNIFRDDKRLSFHGL